MSPQDIALIQRWTETKDPDAFTEIVNRYSGLIYGASLRVLRNRSDAEDVAQECLMRIVEAPTQVESSLGGWLHTVATRRALTKLRADKRRAAREQTFAEGQFIAVEAVWDDLQHMIDDVIADLPEKLHVPVVEHYLLGRTLESIGNDLGVSRQAVHRRLQKGVEQIRTTLRKKGIPITGAALATGFAGIGMAAPNAGLRKGLLNAAVAGIDSNTLVQVASKPPVSWFAAPIIAASIVALVLFGTQVSRSANETSMASPPPAPVNGTVPPVTLDDEPSAPSSFIVAQAAVEESDSTAAGGAAANSGTPDFTEFSLTRPFPEPGVGSLFFYFNTPEAIGAELTITLINWKPWEKTPQTRLTFTETVPESRVVFFKNLPLGTYHSSVRTGTLGVNSVSTLRETLAGEHLNLALWPTYSVDVLVTNEEGLGLTGAEVITYQSQATGELPFHLIPRVEKQFTTDGVVTIPEAVTGIYRIMARAPGYALTPSDWVDARVGTYPIVVAQGGAFECRVVDERGDPVEDVIVHLQGDYYYDHGYARTDQEGLAHVMFLRPVSYKVRVYSLEYVLSGSPATVMIKEGGLASIGDLKVQPGVDIQGRVYDTETELGIPGIRLSVHADTGVAIEDLTTDEDGFYTIPNASFTNYSIARHGSGGYGYGAGISQIDLTVIADGIEGETDFPLTRGIPVSGRVVDTDGRPVMGALIRAGYAQNNHRLDTLSDRRGRFHLVSIQEPGEIYIRAQAAGYGRKILGPFEIPEEGRSDIVLKLPHAALIAGNIKIDGQYAPERTYLWSQPHDPQSEEARSGTGVTYTYCGGMGFYILPWLTPGTYDLSVGPANGARSPTLATVTVEEGQIIDDFIVDYNTSGLALDGFVVDRRGSPVEFAQILARGELGSSIQVSSDAEGAFSLIGLLDSYYAIQASHAQHSTVDVDNVPATQGTLRITMPDRGSVIGTVVAAAYGDAIKRFRVARMTGLLGAPPLSQPSGVTIASDTGTLELNDVEIGDSTLVITAKGFAPELVHLLNVQENQTTNVGAVTLQPATLLTGRITDADGTPISGASISYPMPYYVPVSSQESFARSDSNGMYKVDTLPEGVFDLSVRHRDYAPAQVSVQLLSGQTTDADVTLYGGGALEGIVYVGGVAQGGGMLLLESTDGTMGNQQAQTDSNGHYEFTRVPAGEYTLRAYVPSVDEEPYLSEEYQVVFDNFGTQIIDWTF